MNVSALFIRRPIGTILLAIGVFLIGAVAYVRLPVASLPSIDFPAVFIITQYPGASPETMAATVAAPIERHVGEIPGVTELTSVSPHLAIPSIITLFDLSRNVDGAARDVQAALNAAAVDLPAGLPNVPIFRKANPNNAPGPDPGADVGPVAVRPPIYDAADSVLLQRISQIDGVSPRRTSPVPTSRRSGSERTRPAFRPWACRLDDIRTTDRQRERGFADGRHRRTDLRQRDLHERSARKRSDDYRSLVLKNSNGTSVAPLRRRRR